MLEELKGILFWEKFRPVRIEQVILLPRIKKFLEQGIQTNLLLHGHMGTGKSTIINILLKDKVFKKINASLNNGVDLLRDELLDFCTSMSLSINKSEDKMKYVYLEEFDKSTSAFQDAFKAFIEQYDNRVRFIISMNHIGNAIPEIRSRFNEINFNPKDTYENNFLKDGYFKYLKSIERYLNKKDGFEIDDDKIKKIINKKFPDLRSSVQLIQEIYITNDINLSIDINEDYKNVYNFIMNGNNDVIENFDFVSNNFNEEPENLLKILGRPFIDFLFIENKHIFKEKGFLIIKTTKEHNETFNNQMIDPIIHLTNYVNELKKIIN